MDDYMLLLLIGAIIWPIFGAGSLLLLVPALIIWLIRDLNL